MMSIDGNGQGEIVVIFLTAVETEKAITEMVQSFKVANPRWTETKVVMSDKDFNERSVFRKEFPEHMSFPYPVEFQKRSHNRENEHFSWQKRSHFGNSNKTSLFQI